MKENKLMTYRSFGKKYGRETLQEARNNRINRSRDLLNLSSEIDDKDIEKLKYQYELDNVIREIEKASTLSDDIKNIIMDLKNTVESQKYYTELKKSQKQKGSGKTTKKRSTKKRSTKKRSSKKRSTKKRSSKKRSTKKRSNKKRSSKKRSSKKRSYKKRSTKKRSAKKLSTKKY